MFDAGVSAGPVSRPPKAPWEQWFAWHPVVIHNKCVWLKTVYRRCTNTYVDYDNWERWEYGDVFDMLKENQ